MMERYSMLATNGWVSPVESDTGEWVKFEDVEKLVTTCQGIVRESRKPENFKVPERMAD